MNDEAAQYIAAIDPRHRALFDRVHNLVLHRHPGVDVGISYGMPTYRANGRSLIVGVWKHGLSFYGMDVAGADELVARCGLRTSRGTIQVREANAGEMTDDDFRVLIDQKLGQPAGRGGSA